MKYITRRFYYFSSRLCFSFFIWILMSCSSVKTYGIQPHIYVTSVMRIFRPFFFKALN